MDLLTDWLNLHLATLCRYPEVRVDPTGRAAIQRLLGDRLLTARTVTSQYRDGVLRAVVVIGKPAPSRLGVSEARCWLDLTVDDEQAQQCVVDALRAVEPRLGEDFLLPLDASYGALVPALEALGLGIHKLVVHGRPRTALRHLCETQRAWPDLAALGLRIEPLSRPEHVEQIVIARREYFAANPEHGVLHVERTVDDAVQAAIDQFMRNLLTASLSTGNQFVILRGVDICGSFGFGVQPSHPTLGRCAGVGIALDPSLHGRGLAPLAYKVILERMIELDVDVFRGQTSHPAVLHLARRMKRPLRAWLIQRGTDHYPPGHFDYEHR